MSWHEGAGRSPQMVLEARSDPLRTANLELPVRLDLVAPLLDGLNREQRRAVTLGDGAQVVIAGPGTGKTEVVTRRIAWLIATRRARPNQVLALTFTDNAAQEMQDRVDLLVPYGQADAQIQTFHAFGDRLLREHAFELGLPGDMRLINRAEAVVLLREHLFELGLQRYLPLGNPTRFLGALADLFARAKDEGIEPAQLARHAIEQQAAAGEDVARLDAAEAAAELGRAYARYQQLLVDRGLLDHGDQVSLALRLLRTRPAVRAAVSRDIRYVLVDEFQDVNRAQLEVVALLGRDAQNVTVVGDPNQAIYTFRGAGARNFEQFAELFPRARRVVLRRNYRSLAPIVSAASRLMANGGDAAPDREQPIAARRARRPPAVRVMAYTTADDEANGVADAIAQRLAKGDRPSDIAVLVRSNAEVDPMVRALAVRSVPVRAHAAVNLFGHPEVRPLLAFLRVVADSSQTVELYVLATAWPYRLGGGALSDMLVQARRSHGSLWQQMCQLSDSSVGADVGRRSFRSRVARVVADVRAAIAVAHERSSGELLYDHLRRSGRLARIAAQAEAADARSVARFFDVVRARSSLLADQRVFSLIPHLDALVETDDGSADDGPLDRDAVSVLTVHRAKGLEFRAVYLCGLTDGRFPARARPAAIEVPWQLLHGEPTGTVDPRLAEERRLCYVAMTRARDELQLSHHVAGPGGRGRRRVSPFVAEALDAYVASARPDQHRPERSLGMVAARIETPSVDADPAPVKPARTLSYSQLEDYLDCPERFRLRHVVGLPSPPHHALSYGRALHESVAWFHAETRRAGPPSEEALLDAFRRAWSPEGFMSRAHEDARFIAGRRALRIFRLQQLAHPPPIAAVERPFEFDLDGVRLRGRIDRVDGSAADAVIIDYKSSEVSDQRRANERARESLQLQVYALAHESQTGALPREMRLHFLDSALAGTAHPDETRLERARTKVRDAATGIDRGEFTPKPDPIACGYCPFRQICPSSAA